jgi:hypothetical protein
VTELLTYAKFHTHEAARPLAELLKEASIPVSIEEEHNQLDKLYIGDSLDAMIVVRIPGRYFRKANELVESYPGYYAAPALDEQHIPERLKKESIITGYIFSILIGFVGIFWGLSVITSKKILKNGTRVSIYDDYSKKHARIMLALSIINLYFFLTGRIASWLTFNFNPF